VSTTVLAISPPTAAEHGRRADLLKAEHAKQLAVARQRLGDERADRFERHVAAAQARAAGQQHGVDLRIVAASFQSSAA
jgi:hypothetical protein